MKAGLCELRPFFYFGSLGIARNTRSSMGTVGVSTVELFPSASAICFASPLSAGPAGFDGSAEVSPGCSEMRVVFGVQFGVFKQVSRRNTCRNPLLGAAGATCALAPGTGDSWLGVTATNAT